jgi:ParB-like nuclease domain
VARATPHSAVHFVAFRVPAEPRAAYTPRSRRWAGLQQQLQPANNLTYREKTMNIEMLLLNKLVPSPVNVRKTGAAQGIEQLAASIAADGLLQNLPVRAHAAWHL